MSGRRQRDFEALWTDHHQRVLAYALRRCDRATAEDVVSDTFLVAWRRRSELPRHELAWLLGIARLTLANHARTRRRARALVERHEVWASTATAATDPADVDHDILHALAELPERDREVLLLVGWDGLSATEAATVLGCSTATFRVRLLRARRRLDRELTARAHPTPTAPLRMESTR